MNPPPQSIVKTYDCRTASGVAKALLAPASSIIQQQAAARSIKPPSAGRQQAGGKQPGSCVGANSSAASRRCLWESYSYSLQTAFRPTLHKAVKNIQHQHQMAV